MVYQTEFELYIIIMTIMKGGKNMKCKVFIGTQPVIIIDDDYYTVDTFSEKGDLTKGVAYIIGDYVYPYHGKVKSKKHITNPGIYKIDGEYVIEEPRKKDIDKYSVDNINELSKDSIFQSIESAKEEFIDLEDIEIINNNSSSYKPIITEDDDFLKYVIKKAIIDKNINLKNYKSRFGNEYSLNNMKSALTKPTKMTVVNFLRWCEILGIKFELTVYDAGLDTMNPLPEDITISSDDLH